MKPGNFTFTIIFITCVLPRIDKSENGIRGKRRRKKKMTT
jgi:hypothetical protein